MKKIYFLIPVVVLIVALVPLAILSYHPAPSVEPTNGVLGHGYLQLEKKIGENVSMYYVNLTIDNPGKPEAVCYAENNGNTIPFNYIYIFADGRFYGDSIPSGVNNLTIMIDQNVTLPSLELHLSDGQDLVINMK
ncbi:hypothetical protein IC006_0758 [Sulfuracidifex tepidarius]|uniref:DUF4352 domain-containing protein n=1 Tax=Sulfuracidifex tepidarius TaxID=1294262 RepID=A0A510DTJ3_9CREN|nr:hypothetical protein [Sulfuracidifex tepidarius]BBG23474.1 hypothetical protein IC006_0758 [Sulfuracidifex tepidarius]